LRLLAIKICTRIAKIAPCFAHYGSGGIIFIARIHSPPSFDSAPQTPFIAGPLAVSHDFQQVRGLPLKKANR
jgi:hypothetical protein